MIHKRLGKTEVLIPEVGLGTWNYHGGPEPLRQGVDAGAAFIDTAESYGNESLVGRVVSGSTRVFIATKVSPQNFRPAALRNSVDASLRALRVSTIDLLQLHAPNPAVPIAETMGVLGDLVDEGKIRFLGVSNFSVAELQQAQKALARHAIVSNQVRYNLIDRTIEGGLLDYCQANGITVIAYSPLSRDFTRLLDSDPKRVIDRVSRLLGKSPAQVVLNWCLQKPGVVVIPKGNSVAHVLDNCGASDWRLDPEHLRMLDTEIRYRRRGRLDELVRRYTPRALRPVALKMAEFLPRGLRRRLT